MLSLRVHKNVPGWLLLRLLGSRNRGLCTGRLGLLRLEDLPEPALPGPDWVRIRPRLSGICGSDLAVLQARSSPYFSGVTSMPFTIGHEVVGDITEVGPAVPGRRVRDRVVLRPALGCAARGITPPCAECSAGWLALCLRITRGAVSAGTQTGFCRDTGGAWSEGLLAHHSQVYPVPDHLPDRTAVLTEPLACAVHAVLRAAPADGETALVIGCGTMGLLTVVALRACGFRGRLLAAARHDHQRRLALALGADEVVAAPPAPSDRCRVWAEAVGGEVHPAVLGKPLVLGGAGCVFDCVASAESLDDALRVTAARGRLVLVGMPGIPRGVDWTPLWAKELSVLGSYCYGTTMVAGRPVDAFARALEVLADEKGDRLGGLVGPEFPLADYRRAIRTASRPGKNGSIKVVFRGAREGET
jgi:threonine dehydrogenase-like Zn-dependent dehydrogenase